MYGVKGLDEGLERRDPAPVYNLTVRSRWVPPNECRWPRARRGEPPKLSPRGNPLVARELVVLSLAKMPEHGRRVNGTYLLGSTTATGSNKGAPHIALPLYVPRPLSLESRI